MKDLGKNTVTQHAVPDEAEGQRIDNYLLKILKGVPKSHIYRILRGGEVRINKGRVGPDYRLCPGDMMRVPPIRVAQRPERAAPPVDPGLEKAILYEDDELIVLDKPAGLAVHGGSGISFGVIEQLRAMRPQARFLELVHRLDRDTSGVLMLAKKRSALTALHANLRDGSVKKYYLALVRGNWLNARQSVKLALHKHVLASGERRVSVHPEGQASHTIFELQKKWRGFSLLRAELKTGRTHQIRVHLAHLGFPIVGDDKYGDPELNKDLKQRGMKRMFLHASRLNITHPATGATLDLQAPLPAALENFLKSLENL